jgi:putative endonuclease
MNERLKKHNAGNVISTKAYRPWQLIYCECYANKADALRREGYLKTTAGKKALKLMLRITLQEDSFVEKI